MVEDLCRSTCTEDSALDVIALRIGNTVTDPPNPMHHDGPGIVEACEPAGLDLCPAKVQHLVPDAKVHAGTKEVSTRVFPESSLTAIALSDQVSCLVAAATVSTKPGFRVLACVAPQAYSCLPVHNLMEAWYGTEAASKIEGIDHYKQPGHERDPIYDLSPTKAELGWSPHIDLCAEVPLARAVAASP